MNNDNLKPFKPGTSGNPAGKKKGTKHLSTILKKILREEVDWIQSDLTVIKCEYREAIVRRLLYEAYNGNVRAIHEIFSRVDGESKKASPAQGVIE